MHPGFKTFSKELENVKKDKEFIQAMTALSKNRKTMSLSEKMSDLVNTS